MNVARSEELCPVANYVLVHGAWHGGWCWGPVAASLRGLGHNVYTPTLTGLGERSHLSSPSIGIQTHIDDVVRLLEWEDLNDVVLCGHSSGGLVITGVADRLPERVRALCYLDAFIPKDGDSLLSQLPSDMVVEFLEGVRGAGSGWLVPAPPITLWITDASLGQWVTDQLTMQPLRTFTEGLQLLGDWERIVQRWNVVARDHPRNLFRNQSERLQPDSAWQQRVLPGRHDLMLESPDAVCDVLVEIASRSNEAAH